MTKMTLENGKISSAVNKLVTAEYVCDCGNKFEISMTFPESFSKIKTDGIKIQGVKCPRCDKPAVLPKGFYSVEGFCLVRQADLN